MIVLADGSEIPTRAIIVASGARYRRLAVAELERFEGAGVYYAATDLEVRVCGGSSVRRDRRRQLGRAGGDLPRRRTTAASRSRSAATTSRRRCRAI